MVRMLGEAALVGDSTDADAHLHLWRIATGLPDIPRTSGTGSPRSRWSSAATTPTTRRRSKVVTAAPTVVFFGRARSRRHDPAGHQRSRSWERGSRSRACQEFAVPSRFGGMAIRRDAAPAGRGHSASSDPWPALCRRHVDPGGEHHRLSRSECRLRQALPAAPHAAARPPAGTAPRLPRWRHAAITAYEVGGMYFVVDGHHRVALAHRLEMEYVDAEITAIRISHALTPDVDVRQLIHTEQHRNFKERSRILVRHPEAKIEFSRPTGFGQLLDLVQAHAYEMSVRAEKLVSLEEATADGMRPSTCPRSPPCTRLKSRRPTTSRPRATSTSGCRASAASC